MIRSQLEALVAYLRQRYPQLEISLRPEPTQRSEGLRYQVDVAVRVEMPLYVRTTDERDGVMEPHLIDEEIAAFVEAVSQPARERARRERFYLYANHYFAWELMHRPLGPWQAVDTNRDPRFDAMACARATIQDPGASATFRFTRPSATRSERVAPQQAPVSLWDHLDSETTEIARH